MTSRNVCFLFVYCRLFFLFLLLKKFNYHSPGLKILDNFSYLPSHTLYALLKFLLNVLRDNFLIADMEDDYSCPSNVPYSFPVVKVRITKCSTYTVVSRLKLSPADTITVSGGTFAQPDYPEDTITVPENAVETETKLSLQLKVGCLGYWGIHHYSSCGTLYLVIW